MQPVTALEKVVERDYPTNDEWKTLAGGLDNQFNEALHQLEKMESAIMASIRSFQDRIELNEMALADLRVQRNKIEQASLAWSSTNTERN